MAELLIFLIDGSTSIIKYHRGFWRFCLLIRHFEGVMWCQVATRIVSDDADALEIST